jgi:hypothetical protein
VLVSLLSARPVRCAYRAASTGLCARQATPPARPPAGAVGGRGR